MKPFYRFTLDVATGEVKRMVIDDYEHKSGSGVGYGYYRYRTSHYCYIGQDEFDKYKNHRVYLWEDDIQNAKEIIAQALLEKAEYFENQAQKYKNTIKLMRDYEEAKDSGGWE